MNISLPTRYKTFHRNDFLILKHMWVLEPKYKTILDYNQLFTGSVASFLDNLEPEKFPEYQDKFITSPEPNKQVNFFVTHLYCSSEYLEELDEQTKGEAKLAWYLRANHKTSFYHCLVRPWELNWTLEELQKFGAIQA
jgi:hypothetical protein